MRSVVWWALALLVPVRMVAGEAYPDLLLPVEGGASSPSPSVAALEWLDALVDPVAFDATLLGLPLPSMPTVVLLRDRIEIRGADDFTWYGHAAGELDRRAYFTSVAGQVSGLIYTGTDVYEVFPRRPGVVTIARLDQDLFPPCGSDVEANGGNARTPASENAVFEPGGIVAESVREFAAPESLRSPEEQRQLDVLVVYTPQALAAAGGEGALLATIRSAVDSANSALGNSAMIARFRLVGTALTGHSESGTMATELSWVSHDAEVAALRNRVRADLVSLFTEAGDECGRGYVLLHGVDPRTYAPLAFQVTRRTCAVGNLSYVHEHGHNLGMQHNPEDGRPAGEAAAPWAFGHYSDGAFRTVMSYSSPCVQGCPRVPQFSNPAVTYAGRATGVAGQRDNHRIGDEIAGFAVDWRSDLAPLFADGFEGGSAGGWSATTP